MKFFLLVASVLLFAGSAGGLFWMGNYSDPSTEVDIQCALPTDVMTGEESIVQLKFQNTTSRPIRIVGLTQC